MVTDLFEVAWTVIAAAIQKSVNSEGGRTMDLISGVLLYLSHTLSRESPLGNCVRNLVVTVVNGVLDQCTAFLDVEENEPTRGASIVGILEAFGDLVFADSETTKVCYSLAYLYGIPDIPSECRRPSAMPNQPPTYYNAITPTPLLPASPGGRSLLARVAPIPPSNYESYG